MHGGTVELPKPRNKMGGTRSVCVSPPCRFGVPLSDLGATSHVPYLMALVKRDVTQQNMGIWVIFISSK